MLYQLYLNKNFFKVLKERKKNLGLSSLYHQVTFLFLILFVSLELPFRVADVPPLGQAWETAVDALVAGKREYDEV